MLSSDTNTATTLYTEYLNKFGNLTLTAYNANLSNKDFESKKNHTDKDGNIIGYQSPRNLKLNEDIKNLSRWSGIEIKERGEKIIKILYKLLEIEMSDYAKSDKKVKKAKKRQSSTTRDFYEHGLIKKGDKVSIKNYSDSSAEIIDGKMVLYKNKELSFNQWGLKVTGWQAIQIYAHAYLEKDNKMFEELRKEV